MIQKKIDVSRAEQLQFLRFCAFCLIFLWHANNWAFDFFPGGGNGAAEAVSFFFILSGLVTGYSAYGKEISFSVKNVILYIWKKIKKLYPLYFFTTFFSIAYSGIPMFIANHQIAVIEDNIIQLIKSLLLVQSWFPTNYFYFNSVGWFLSTMMFLYMLNIPLNILLSKINKNKHRYVIFGVLFVILYVGIIVYCYLIRNSNMEFWAYVFPPSKIPEYMLGMIVGFVVHSFIAKVPDSFIMKLIFTGLEIVSLFVWIYALYCPIIPWQYRIIHWLFPNIFLLCVFTFGKGYVSNLFRRKFLNLLGDISFECYLLHQIIIIIYVTMSGVGSISKLGNLFSILFCMCSTVCLAYLISDKSKREK